jgi:hypothetical protein
VSASFEAEYTRAYVTSCATHSLDHSAALMSRNDAISTIRRLQKTLKRKRASIIDDVGKALLQPEAKRRNSAHALITMIDLINGDAPAGIALDKFTERARGLPLKTRINHAASLIKDLAVARETLLGWGVQSQSALELATHNTEVTFNALALGHMPQHGADVVRAVAQGRPLGVVSAMMESFFWLVLFDYGNHIPSFWIECEVTDRESAQLKRNFEKMKDTMAKMYGMLKLRVPDCLNTTSTLVVASKVPVVISELAGYAEFLEVYVLAGFSRTGERVSWCLDTGACRSSIDRKLLLEMYPEAKVSLYPNPWTSHGIGGGSRSELGYTMLDLYVDCKVRNDDAIAMMTFQVDVVDDEACSPFLGADFIEAHGIIINTRDSIIKIGRCQNAIAPIQKDRWQFEQNYDDAENQQALTATA